MSERTLWRRFYRSSHPQKSPDPSNGEPGGALTSIVKPRPHVLARIAGAFLALLLVLVSAFLVADTLSPAWTLRTVVRAGTTWQRHWPFQRGYYAPDRVIGLLYTIGAAKPVEVEVWPGAVFELDARDLVAR